EGRQVAACADRTAARHDGKDAPRKEPEEQLDRLDAAPRLPLREGVRPEQHGRAHDRDWIWLTNAARVTAENAQLELFGLLLGNRLRYESPEAGVDPVRVLPGAV